MKIINGPIKKGKFKLSFGLAVSVSAVARVTEKTASELITRVESSDRYLFRHFLHPEEGRIGLTGQVYIDYPLSGTRRNTCQKHQNNRIPFMAYR